MKNKTKYQLRIDTNKLVILDDNYVHTINKLIRDKEDDVSDFMVEIIDQYNLIDDELNTITNYYIEELLKENRCFAIMGDDYPNMIKDFIMTSIDVINRNRNNSFVFNDEFIIFDIVKGYDYFKINVRIDCITKEKYNEFIVLGPDYLMGNSLAYLKEVVPAFYSFLYVNDALYNEKMNDLKKYQIGLH